MAIGTFIAVQSAQFYHLMKQQWPKVTDSNSKRILMFFRLLLAVFLLHFFSCGSAQPNKDIDDDFDGIPDVSDSFPDDTDNDGIKNSDDSDDDNDGVVDGEDSFPFDPAEWLDTDSDGIGNNEDTDDDGDGILDVHDVFPLDKDESFDTNSNGVGNNTDPDADSDNFSDENDLFPTDVARAGDHDGDSIDSLQDLDDDNDGYLDSVEISESSNSLDVLLKPADTDNDGLTDRQELSFGSNVHLSDSDSDGLSDKVEFRLQTDPNSNDTDNDGKTDAAEVGSDLSNIPDFDKDGLIDAKDYYGIFEFRTLEDNPQAMNDRFGLSVGPNGNIYIADPLVHEVRIYNKQGLLQNTIGREGDGNGEFFYPNDVAVCEDGSTYVADTNNNRIQQFDSNGNFLEKFFNAENASALGAFLFPRGLDCQNNILDVADSQNSRKQRYLNGAWSSTDLTISFVDVALSEGGLFATANRADFSVFVFSEADALFSTMNANAILESPFSLKPTGVAFDSENNLYILDESGSRVLVFDAEGNYLRQFGEGKFLYPSSIHIDTQDKLYITDRNKMQIF